MPDNFQDPVVDQLHRLRVDMLADAGNDPAKLLEQAGERQNHSEHPVISAPPLSASLPSTR